MYNTPLICQTSTVKQLTAVNGSAVIDAGVRYWLKIAIFARVRASLSEYCNNVWYGKLEWCGHLMVKKF